MMDDLDHLTYGVRDGIATVTWDRPEKLNAITPAMRRAFIEALRTAEADPAVHVIVLKGNGRAWCVGVDLEDMSRAHQDPAVRGVRLDAREIYEAADRWGTLWMIQKPIVVKVQGLCVGWGLEIALYADIVVAAEDAQFNYPSVRNGTGLPDSNMAIYHLGPQWAKYMLFTGDFIDGRTAERIGLVLKAVPEAELDDEVETIARRMPAVPVDLLAESKGVLNKAIDLMGRHVLQQIAAESNAISRLNPFVAEWTRRVREEGNEAAIAWREERQRAVQARSDGGR